MAIDKISTAVKSAIKRKSVYGLSDEPTVAGKKASDIKKAMYGFVTDADNSILNELDRIVDEANADLSANTTLLNEIADGVLPDLPDLVDDMEEAVENVNTALENVSTILYNEVTVSASGWSNNEYTISTVQLSDGDNIIIYSAGSGHTEILTFSDAWNDAEITYSGDDSTNEITLTAETAPTIDIDVIVEVRK